MLVLAFPTEPKQGRGTLAASRGAARAAAHPLPVVRHDGSPEDQVLTQQAQAFDATIRLRSEAEREMNALRELSMEQVKRDDELLKKWISLI